MKPLDMHPDCEVFKGGLFSAPVDHEYSKYVGRICFLRKGNGIRMEWEECGKEWDEELGAFIILHKRSDKPQHFRIGHLQHDYRGRVCLRVYECDENGNQDGYNTFGQCAHPRSVCIVR